MLLLKTALTPQMAVNNTIDSPKVSYPRKSNTTAVTELIAEVLEIVSFRIICEASPKSLFSSILKPTYIK